MFTIKVRSAPRGVSTPAGVVVPPGADIEDLYEATAIKVVRSGDMFKDGIFLDPEFGDALLQDDPNADPPLLSAKHVILFGHEGTESGQRRKGGRVWVMNETGQTIASYDL